MNNRLKAAIIGKFTTAQSYKVQWVFLILRLCGLQGATITPRNFLKAGCYSIFGELFRDFSSAGYYSRSLALPNNGVLGVIEVNGARILR